MYPRKEERQSYAQAKRSVRSFGTIRVRLSLFTEVPTKNFLNPPESPCGTDGEECGVGIGGGLKLLPDKLKQQESNFGKKTQETGPSRYSPGPAHNRGKLGREEPWRTLHTPFLRGRETSIIRGHGPRQVPKGHSELWL